MRPVCVVTLNITLVIISAEGRGQTFSNFHASASAGTAEGGTFTSLEGPQAEVVFDTSMLGNGTPNYGNAKASATIDPARPSFHISAVANRTSDMLDGFPYGDDIVASAQADWTESFDSSSAVRKARVTYKMTGSFSGQTSVGLTTSDGGNLRLSPEASADGLDAYLVDPENQTVASVNTYSSEELGGVLKGGGHMGITSTLPLPPTQGLSITFSIDFSMVVQAVTNGIGTAKADFSNTLTVTSIELLDAADHLIPGIGYAAGSGRWYPVANIQPGDFNHDGHVDSGDFTVWVADVGETGVTPDHGDGDSDTDVDGGDFLLWQRQLGTTSLLPSTTTVPEPATAALIMCALLGARCSSKTRRSPGIGA